MLHYFSNCGSKHVFYSASGYASDSLVWVSELDTGRRCQWDLAY